MKAIIFDFDGTILDTEQAEYAAWNAIYQEHGHVVPLDKYSQCVGTDQWEFDPLQHLQTLVGQSMTIAGIEDRRQKKVAELLVQLQPMPGVLDWIECAKKLHLKLAIASNSTNKWVTSHLSRLNLIKYFDAIATCDEVTHTKPHPEVYQVALRKLQVNPQEAFAIEDSFLGAQAALAANIPCIAVPNQILSHLPFPETFLRVDSLSNLQLQDVIHQMVPPN